MRRTIVMGVAGGLVVVLGLFADVASASGLDLRLQLTSHRPATPTGAVLHIVYPDDGPGGRPKPVSKGVYEFPAGTRIDEGAVPTCTASDTDFDLFGPSACPSSTNLGGGGITVDTGLGAPIDPMSLDDSYFHGPGEVVTVFTPHGAPGPVLQVNRLKIQGSTIIDLPSLPPGYPPGTKTVPKQVDQQIAQVSSGGRAFMTTPSSCPATGSWISRLTLFYEDGTMDSHTSATPCESQASAVKAHPPRHRLRRHRAHHRRRSRR
jgi:hypothetical protein